MKLEEARTESDLLEYMETVFKALEADNPILYMHIHSAGDNRKQECDKIKQKYNDAIERAVEQEKKLQKEIENILNKIDSTGSID